MAYWQGEGARTYHHTAPVNAMHGLHEALLMVKEEGMKTRGSVTATCMVC